MSKMKVGKVLLGDEAKNMIFNIALLDASGKVVSAGKMNPGNLMDIICIMGKDLDKACARANSWRALAIISCVGLGFSIANQSMLEEEVKKAKRDARNLRVVGKEDK